ncbi:cobalt-precorrin 5A hydrolase [Labilibacter sediminis]|nr:cobalt-precorrin 5A hydrolase [Labilibacter sediminis]
MIAIISISKNGNELALKLADQLTDAVCYTLPKWQHDSFESIQGRLKDFCEVLFAKHESLIFIMASGIVVRSIAPWIKDKTTDPAVLVMDEKGHHVISLLSGHLGGANVLCLKIAKLISANPVITTASDVNDLPSVDMLAKSKGLVIDSMTDAKEITAMIVNGEKVTLKDEYGIFLENPLPMIEGEAQGLLVVSNKKSISESTPFAQLIPKNIYLGIGCKRNTEPEHLFRFIQDTLDDMNLDERSIQSISSIDVKSDEDAIHRAAERLNGTLTFYPKEELQKVDHLFDGSEFVKSTVGVASVSTTSAYLSGGKKGSFLLKKKKKDGMTLSVFRKKNI